MHRSLLRVKAAECVQMLVYKDERTNPKNQKTAKETHMKRDLDLLKLLLPLLLSTPSRGQPVRPTAD